MKLYKIMITTLMCCLVIFTGCTKQAVKKDVVDNTATYIKYVILNTSGMTDDLKSANKKFQDTRGHILLSDDKNYYISVFAGKKPNVGYPIIVTKVEIKESVTYITVKEGQPKEGVKTPDIETSPLCSIKIDKKSVPNKFKVITEKNDELIKLN